MTTQEKEFATSQEKVDPGVFHIHIDTNDNLKLPNENAASYHHWAREELGFIEHNFIGHPDGYVHFEPTMHSSIKLRTRQEFDQMWDRILQKAKTTDNIAGYLEGEHIPTDELLPFKELVTFEKPKFKIERRQLSVERGEKFRQTEFHLGMDYDNSDQRVIKALLDAGLYGALLPKKDYRMIVLTMQGYIKQIKPLMEDVKEYLMNVGGVVRCTLKEERALRNYLMGINPSHLPEIADSITTF